MRVLFGLFNLSRESTMYHEKVSKIPSKMDFNFIEETIREKTGLLIKNLESEFRKKTNILVSHKY